MDHSAKVMVVTPWFDPAFAGPALLSEHGPCLVGGMNFLDDTSFTTKITAHLKNLPRSPRKQTPLWLISILLVNVLAAGILQTPTITRTRLYRNLIMLHSNRGPRQP